MRDASDALEVLPAPHYSGGGKGDLLIANLPQVRREVEKIASTAPYRNIGEVRFLSPIANPTKIIRTPVNYLKHAEEADAQREVFTARYRGSIEEQGLFLKATSALVGCGEGVRTRFADRRTDHELELGVVIGKPAVNVSEGAALQYVAGYAIAFDMVVRGPEDRSLHICGARALADDSRRSARPRASFL